MRNREGIEGRSPYLLILLALINYCPGTPTVGKKVKLANGTTKCYDLLVTGR